MSVKIMSVKIMSVKIMSGKILINFSKDFSGISDLRLADNCLKMTAYDVLGCNESKTVILDAKSDQQSTFYCLSCSFML